MLLELGSSNCSKRNEPNENMLIRTVPSGEFITITITITITIIIIFTATFVTITRYM